MRVFLDANVLVAIGFRPSGDYSRILDFANIEFVTSEHILHEVNENLMALGIDASELLDRLRREMEVTDQVTVLPVGLPLTDDEDRQALAEAIGSRCDLFVTFNSRDFSALYGRTILGVTIRHSADFVRNPFGQDAGKS
jgi:predicted nucleic acid-binding protein